MKNLALAAAFFRTPAAGWVLLAALSLWLAFPNPLCQLPFMALLYPLCLARLARGGSKKRVFRLGWLAAFLGNSAALYWVAIVPHDFGHMPWVAAIPFPLLLSAYIALYAGVFCLAARAFLPLPALVRAVGLAALWVCCEYLRGWLFTGFPWLSLSTAFALWPVCVQGADILGAYGLSGFIVFVVMLADSPSRRHIPAKALAVALLALSLFYGQLRLDQLPEEERNTPSQLALLVQGDIDQHIKWTADSVLDTLNNHIALSLEGFEQSRADVVIWPETAAPFSLRNRRSLLIPLLSLARKTGTAFIIGAPGFTESAPGQASELENRAELITPDGLMGWYAKEHLVPFGEYVPPFLDFEFLAFALQEVGGFSPGTNQAPLRLPNGTPLGVLICYEVIFPELAADRTQSGAQVLVNISNDAWFGHSPAMLQHLQQAAMRSIEQRRWMLRATTNGLTAIIDAGGRINAAAPSHMPTTLSGEYKPRFDTSIFSRIRTFILPVALAVLILAIWASRLYMKKSG